MESGEIMTIEAREARRAYKRNWQRNNPDKVKEYQKRYWEKKAQEAAKDKSTCSNIKTEAE